MYIYIYELFFVSTITNIRTTTNTTTAVDSWRGIRELQSWTCPSMCCKSPAQRAWPRYAHIRLIIADTLYCPYKVLYILYVYTVCIIIYYEYLYLICIFIKLYCIYCIYILLHILSCMNICIYTAALLILTDCSLYILYRR